MNYMQKILDFCRKNRVSTTEVADALGKTGVFPRVLPINNNQYRIGPVRCVFTANGSNYAVHEQVRDVNAGEVVLLLTHQCTELAIIGDLVAKYTILYRGAESVVVQGLVRDAAKLRREGYPVWSEGVSPLGCHNRPADPYPKELELEMRKSYEGGIAICDDGGVTVIPGNRINADTLERLQQIEMQEDIWFFCLDTLKWDTKKIVCDKDYLKESDLFSKVHLDRLNILKRPLDYKG
jgi:4-hydroxy-4-methyl-2-oxoglutarate aldolase